LIAEEREGRLLICKGGDIPDSRTGLNTCTILYHTAMGFVIVEGHTCNNIMISATELSEGLLVIDIITHTTPPCPPPSPA